MGSADSLNESGSQPLFELDFDDADLRRLGAARAERLFPALDRARAMRSLLVVLAIVPSLYVVHHRRLSDFDALWGLKAMELLSSAGAARVFETSHSVGTALAEQPPLVSFLCASTMRLVGTDWPVSLVLVSYLCFAGVVLVTGRLLSIVQGDRTALIAGCLIGVHAPLLQWVQSACPVMLSLFLALTCVDFFVRHARNQDGVVSRELLLAGLALGLCLLACGLWAVWAAVTALVIAELAGCREPGGWTANYKLGQVALSWVVMLLTAFAVGGWWYLMVTHEHGTDWVIAQWRQPAVRAPLRMMSTASDTFTWLSIMGGGLLGLTTTGLLRAVRVQLVYWARRSREQAPAATQSAAHCDPAARGSDSASDSGAPQSETRRGERNCPLTLLAWLALAGVLNLVEGFSAESSSLMLNLTQAWLALAVVALIAWTINEIAEIRLRLWETLAAFGIAIVWLFIQPLPEGDSRVSASLAPMLTVGCTLMLMMLAGWCLRGRRTTADRNRLILSLLIVVIWSGHLTGSLRALTFDEGPYLSTLRTMSYSSKVDEAVCVTSSPLPSEMKYTVRALNRGRPLTMLDGLQSMRRYLDDEVSQTVDAAVLGLNTTLPNERAGASHFERRILVAEWMDEPQAASVIRQRGWRIDRESPVRFIERQPFRVRILTWRPDLPEPYSQSGLAVGQLWDAPKSEGSDLFPWSEVLVQFANEMTGLGHDQLFEAQPDRVR